MLLVACFKNDNNEIQVISVGVVSIENEENWSWFMQFVLTHLQQQPAFIISDRDKELLPAVKKLCHHIRHYYCFLHVLENFNKKFKSKLLRNLAWRLGRVASPQMFNAAVNSMDFVDKERNCVALRCREKKMADALQSSPQIWCVDVESVNSALKCIICLPIIECLMAIERYVDETFSKNTKSWSDWGSLTKSCSTRVENALNRYISSITALENSENTFVISYQGSPGDVPAEFAVVLLPPSCSCSFPVDMAAPCQHLLYAIHQKNKLLVQDTFFDHTWTTATFTRAYPNATPLNALLCVIEDDPVESDCKAPIIAKRRGRPRHRRQKYQPGTLSLDQGGGEEKSEQSVQAMPPARTQQCNVQNAIVGRVYIS